jgi:hypothetical protein
MEVFFIYQINKMHSVKQMIFNRNCIILLWLFILWSIAENQDNSTSFLPEGTLINPKEDVFINFDPNMEVISFLT